MRRGYRHHESNRSFRDFGNSPKKTGHIKCNTGIGETKMLEI